MELLTSALSDSMEGREATVDSRTVAPSAEFELQKHEANSAEAGVTVSAGQQRQCLLIFAQVLNLSWC